MENRFDNNNRGYTSQATGALVGTLLGVVILALGLYFIFGFGSNQAITNENTDDIKFFNQSQETNMTPPTNTNPPAGLQAEILNWGSGEAAKVGDEVTVNYTGWLTDGTKFDSSYDRGQTFQFTLGAGKVIPGWEKGVDGMKIGEKRKLIVPPDLGYGEAGTPGGPIPPNATLIFEIELVKIN